MKIWLQWFVLLVALLAIGFYARHTNKPFEKPFWYKCGDAECDYESSVAYVRAVAEQEMINSFRVCQSVYVQNELESLQHFVERIPNPHTDSQCLLLRNSVQGPGQHLYFNKGMHVFGGTFRADPAPAGRE